MDHKGCGWASTVTSVLCELVRSIEHFQGLRNSGHFPAGSRRAGEAHTIAEPFEQNLSMGSSRALYVRPNCGEFGHDPMATRRGDYVVTYRTVGGNSWFICGRRDNSTSLVGEAYIQEVMKKSLDSADSGKLE